jgi:hypothetical protein
MFVRFKLKVVMQKNDMDFMDVSSYTLINSINTSQQYMNEIEKLVTVL